MTITLDERYKIKDSVDVYINDTDPNQIVVQFYKINTRQRLSIILAPDAVALLAKIRGAEPLYREIATYGGDFDNSEAVALFSYLYDKGILQNVSSGPNSQTYEPNHRYSRQINFFDDLFYEIPGKQAQSNLLDSRVTIIGAGSAGAELAIQLARAGILFFELIDAKRLGTGSLERHRYANATNIGEYKVNALSEYLQRINSAIQVRQHVKRIKPTTNLLDLISSDTDLVVNTADEPYIGHTSMKIGRFLWPLGIPMYTMGGFDAHLMSGGDFIIPNVTPCIDCCANSFQRALKHWKPQYIQPDAQEGDVSLNTATHRPIPPLGQGGTQAQSQFVAAYAAAHIIWYLAGSGELPPRLSYRGEFLINRGHMTWFKIEKQTSCNVCN